MIGGMSMGVGTGVLIATVVLLVVVVVALVWSDVRARLGLDGEAELEAVPEPEAWLERMTARRIVVHTTDGQSLDGLLRESTVDGLVLSAVKLVEDNPVPLAGDLFIPRGRVQMIQRPEE